jgi:tetratricopeptide (TPR) repeat protein
LLSDWAILEEETFQEPQRAAELYARVLKHAPGDASALKALPRLLLAAGNAEEAAKVLEKHRGRVADEERANLEAELAELYLERLNRPADALEAAGNVLQQSTHDPRAIAVLKRLVSHGATKEKAAEMLAAEYAAVGDARQEADALSAVLSVTTDSVERRNLYERLADVYEKKLESHNSALDIVLRAVREFPSDLEIWQHAETLAARSNRPTELADAYREVLRAELSPEVELELCEPRGASGRSGRRIAVPRTRPRA